MPEEDKKLIQRYDHDVAAVTVNSDCVEVILFGGLKELLLGTSRNADTVVLRFGKCSCVMISNIIIVYSNCNPQFTVLLIVNMYLLHNASSDYVYSVNWC